MYLCSYRLYDDIPADCKTNFEIGSEVERSRMKLVAEANNLIPIQCIRLGSALSNRRCLPTKQIAADVVG